MLNKGVSKGTLEDKEFVLSRTYHRGGVRKDLSQLVKEDIIKTIYI